MTDIDLDAIQARADNAKAHLGDISRCEFLSITPGPSSHRGVAASQRDVPALIAAVRERDATIARARELHVTRRGMWGDGCASCGRNLPCPTLRALDPQEGR